MFIVDTRADNGNSNSRKAINIGTYEVLRPQKDRKKVYLNVQKDKGSDKASTTARVRFWQKRNKCRNESKYNELYILTGIMRIELI